MIDLIYDIFNQLVDLYQQFMGVPEGISYALFGSRKKKKAKKKLAQAQSQIDDNLTGAIDTSALDSIPNDTGEGFEVNELVTNQDTIPGTDTPEIPYIPEFPYVGSQIILNSNRLHLNAKEDFIILNSKKSISLSAPGSINIDTEGAFIINAQKVRLGIGDEAKHPLVYGDNLVNLLNQIQQQFQKIQDELSRAVDSTSAPIQSSRSAAVHLKALVKIIDVAKSNLTSQRNFTQ